MTNEGKVSRLLTEADILIDEPVPPRIADEQAERRAAKTARRERGGKMSLPATVRIGLYDYAISDVEGLRDGEDACWGLVSHQHHTIKVESDTTLRHKQYILWHEMLHSMLAQAGWHGVDHEESLVIALGHAIVGMLRNNPDVIAYTLEEDEQPHLPNVS